MSYWDDFCFRAYEIEYRLGVLRGNEAAMEWWSAVKEHWNTSGEDIALIHQSVGYISSTSDVSYNVQFTMVPVPMGTSDDDQYNIQNSLRLEADAAWHTGQEWAAGIGSYLVDLCSSFCKPDVAAMRSAMNEFAAVRTKLKTTVPANWTELDVEGWIGTGHDSFAALIRELYSLMDQYETALALAENWFTASAAMISQVQHGALQLLDDVSKLLDTQLQQWASTEGLPESFGGSSPLIADVLTIGDDVLSFVPAYSDLKGKVENVVKLTTDAAHLFGVDPSFDLSSSFTLRTATDIYTGLTKSLLDQHVTPLATTLAKVGHRSSPVRADIASLHGHFYPPTLPDPGTVVWEPSFSHST